MQIPFKVGNGITISVFFSLKPFDFKDWSYFSRTGSRRSALCYSSPLLTSLSNVWRIGRQSEGFLGRLSTWRQRRAGRKITLQFRAGEIDLVTALHECRKRRSTRFFQP